MSHLPWRDPTLSHAPCSEVAAWRGLQGHTWGPPASPTSRAPCTPSDPRGSPAPHSGEHPKKTLTPLAPEPPSTPHREPAPHPPSSPHPPIPPGSHLGARCPLAPRFPPRPPPRSPLRNAPGAGRGGRSAAAAAANGAPAGYGGGTHGRSRVPAVPCPTVPYRAVPGLRSPLQPPRWGGWAEPGGTGGGRRRRLPGCARTAGPGSSSPAPFEGQQR